MGVDLILAGIHAEVKLLSVEKIVPVAVHKNTQKRKNNAFDFCIIQFSQSYYLYVVIDVFTEMCRIQKMEGKVHTKLIRSFGNVTARSNRRYKGDNYHFLVILKKYLFISAFVDFTIGNSYCSYV